MECSGNFYAADDCPSGLEGFGVSALLKSVASFAEPESELNVAIPSCPRSSLVNFQQESNILLGHFQRIFKEPSGEPQRDWIDNIENDGVIYYRWLFNEPRILVTNPKALAEVLVQRNYEFIKPQRIRDGLGRLLGVGILLAEGDEHKVGTR